MKTRIAFPLLFAVSFLTISAASSSAQINPAYPYNIEILLQSASITHDLNQTTIKPDTIYGYMRDISALGTYQITINITTAKQWVISTKIDGVIVNNGDVMSISQGLAYPIDIIVVPYAETPDTESYCLTLSLSPSYVINGKCITLTTTNTPSAVTAGLITPKITTYPNPAGNYISVSGLSDPQAGYKYEIFSISGAEVLHGILPANARINIQDINSGAYRVLLYDAKQLISNTGITVVH